MRQIYFGGKVYTGSLPLQEAFIVEDENLLRLDQQHKF